MRIVRESEIEVKCNHCKTTLGVQEKDLGEDQHGRYFVNCCKCGKFVVVPQARIPKIWFNNPDSEPY